MAEEPEARPPGGDESGREEPAVGEGEDRSFPYRGPASDYDGEVYPRSYRTPGRINLKKALREYVEGHDRGWDQETKSRKAAESLESGESEKGYLGPGQAMVSGEPTETVSAEKTPSEAADVPADELRPRFGVGVPRTLRFHRGADTWRDRVKELIHGVVEEAPDDGRD